MSETNIEGNSRATSPAGREPDHFRRVMIIWIVVSIMGIVIWALLSPVILPKRASYLDGTYELTITVLTNLPIPLSKFVFVFVTSCLFFFSTMTGRTEM